VDDRTRDLACRMLGVVEIPAEAEATLARAKVLKDKVGSGSSLSLDSIAVCLSMMKVADGKPEKKAEPKHNAFSGRVMALRKENTVAELRDMYEAVLGKAPSRGMRERSLAESIAKAEVTDG